LLLLLGLRRARQPESAEHPLGHYRVVYFYALMVALLLFTVGGLFSVYEGWHRLHAAEPLRAPWVALTVLGVAIALEAVSLWGALREIRKEQHGRSFWRWFRETRQSELMVVAGEDIAALGGLVLAFVAVLATMATGNPLYDALGSIAVGVLLIVVAAAILLEVKGMIVGESAEPRLREEIAAFIAVQPEVGRVQNLITLQWGEKLVIAVQAEMAQVASAAELVAAINRVETAIQTAYPQARWVFFEPDLARPVEA
jgi:cation diffusion facilitator family transporter